MKHQSKFSQHEQQEQVESGKQHSGGREFSSAEEMLRHDAIHVVVPPVVGQRLANSIQNLPRPAKSWRRWFGL